MGAEMYALLRLMCQLFFLFFKRKKFVVCKEIWVDLWISKVPLNLIEMAAP
jgi:hypothetical protein